MINAILFDVDGVLLDSDEANKTFYRELFRQIGNRQPDEQTFIEGKHLSVEAMLRKVFPDLSDKQIHYWMIRADEIDLGFDVLRPMPGVIKVLPVLAEKYKLGLVTNRTMPGVEELWNIIPCRNLFASIAAYESTKKHKPDPEPVRFAMNQLGVAPEETVFIGDAITDYESGHAAGVYFIMYGQTTPPDGVPVLQDFNLLPDLLHSRYGS